MPELPEVETIARGIEPLVLNKTIQHVTIRYAGILHTDLKHFEKQISDKTIIRVWRRAKLLIFDLEPDLHLVFHLKMTGKVWIPQHGQTPDKHTHLVFGLNDGMRIFFEDMRKFGYCALFDDPGFLAWKFYSQLGPEPLDLSEDEFIEIFSTKKGRIKALLLDQKNIAGIGNIYADESLFMAGIHPETPGNLIDIKDLKRLYQCLVQVLNQAIEAGGSSFRDYRNALGYSGMFQEKFLIYGKKGQCCPHCQTMVETRKVAGRTSCICPSCQKIPTGRVR
ncbi:MAG: bifunctional DNA-formamidopyrimidine glycosylase/DNA-(apurinic or apyrimidinic site) lyase [Desulfovibrionales bacterium]|nr:bifunctional DNA-formamidopyrimidine glycosylase/DNA-(apurinic or apyrimidinic site) lyase [Desulfovibrionales bacterium]